ncbi:C-terminal binding protein [Quadrisphaera sp. DSM 44207]|uniref:C-terminal binding protein n=1 Tax=Quadrisphaera sp. DSM 44207 TaxID=1881057 RepID=UPI00088A33BB|nr:C-terminal binding protein [Quadrisphaera sp. DSM 44207]SDQ84863.1 D-3-phosphoglycerate dehydrogenase [Quadrisphaera sp. DSM 44207]
MRVLVTDAEYEPLDLEAAVLAEGGHELVVAHCRTAAEVAQAARGADALLVQYAPVTEEVFAAAPSVRLVSRYGVGVDGVDLDAARRHGVWVANVPDYGVAEVALHAVAMLLALLRDLPGRDRAVREHRWHYAAGAPLHRPSTRVLGVVGLGRIGRLAAERAAPWFGACVGHDPALPDDAWPPSVERAGLEEVFARAYAVTLHLPLTARTQGLVGDALLARLPVGSHLVNTSRGGLVDLDAVLRALESGRLAGVALDVLPSEPPDWDHPLVGHPRALITPHAAWYSQESEAELRRKAARNVLEWARTGEPLHPVVRGRS